MASGDFIDRFTPDLKVSVGGETITCTYDNTDVFQFGKYGMFDHVHYHPEDDNHFIFNCDDLIQGLIAHGFPHHHFPYPPEDVVDFYLTHSAETIDSEMEGLDGTS